MSSLEDQPETAAPTCDVKAEVEPKSEPDIEPETLPALSPSDFRAYNRLSVHMQYFHNHFREEWNMLYDACSSGSRPMGMSLRQFISRGIEFCHHLEGHHSIEENYVFPILAKKMPAFRRELHLLSQHKKIHAGLDVFQEYMRECKAGDKELRMEEMKKLMDGFKDVLWSHLDDEVKELGAENMRKYWTLQEMKMLQM